MNDTTITALLERLETLAVSVHLHQRNATQLRADLDAAIERGDRLAAVAKDGQARIDTLKQTVDELGRKLGEARDRIRNLEAVGQRRIDVVDGETTLVEWGRIAVTDGHARAEVLLRWLREPVGGAS